MNEYVKKALVAFVVSLAFGALLGVACSIAVLNASLKETSEMIEKSQEELNSALQDLIEVENRLTRICRSIEEIFRSMKARRL